MATSPHAFAGNEGGRGVLATCEPPAPRAAPANRRIRDALDALGSLASKPSSSLERLLASSPMYDAVIDEVDGRRSGSATDGLSTSPRATTSASTSIRDRRPWVRRHAPLGLRIPSWSRSRQPRALRRHRGAADRVAACADALVLPTITHSTTVSCPYSPGWLDLHRRTGAPDPVRGMQGRRGQGRHARRYPADDLEALERRSDRARPRPEAICTDGVNSMTGNVPDRRPSRLAREHGATLYVDDAHGFGVIGERSYLETRPYGPRQRLVRYSARRTRTSSWSAASPRPTPRSWPSWPYRPRSGST